MQDAGSESDTYIRASSILKFTVLYVDHTAVWIVLAAADHLSVTTKEARPLTGLGAPGNPNVVAAVAYNSMRPIYLP
jgi:hypothetical protein